MWIELTYKHSPINRPMAYVVRGRITGLTSSMNEFQYRYRVTEFKFPYVIDRHMVISGTSGPECVPMYLICCIARKEI